MLNIPGHIADVAMELQVSAGGCEANLETISLMVDSGHAVQVPPFDLDDFSTVSASGEFLARLPKFMHRQLAVREKK